MKVLPKPLSFVWDEGNSWKPGTHDVAIKEAEQAFFDKHKKMFRDHLHSGSEERFRVIGKTKKKRLLFVVFTVRKDVIRIISARDTNKKEVPLYEKAA